MAVSKSFSFNTEEYPELAAWITALETERGRLSREITRILHAHVTATVRPSVPRTPETETWRTIRAQLDRIEARLAGSVALAAAPDAEPASGELPDDVLAALDALAL